jgi:exonuclease VII small subunit
MDSEQLRAHLAQAERHVAECRGHIARQRQIVEQLSLKDESREEAVVMLTILEDSLRIFEQHCACAASRCKS